MEDFWKIFIFWYKNYTSNTKKYLTFWFNGQLLPLKMKIKLNGSIERCIGNNLVTFPKFKSLASIGSEKNVPKGQIFRVEKNAFKVYKFLKGLELKKFSAKSQGPKMSIPNDWRNLSFNEICSRKIDSNFRKFENLSRNKIFYKSLKGNGVYHKRLKTARRNTQNSSRNLRQYIQYLTFISETNKVFIQFQKFLS